MKTMFALLLVIAALMVSAQTNFDVLVCKDASYTNATIIRTTPAYAVVMHSDGISKVALTNLPESLQKKYGYDPDKAAAALASEEKQQADAKAKRLKELAGVRGTNREIQVVVVLDNLGQCQTSVGRVYLAGVPASVSEYANRYTALKSEVENLTVIVDKVHRGSIAVGKEGWYPGIMQDWQLAEDDLQKKTPSLKVMEKGLVKNTSVVAFPTGTKYGGLPLWQCVGVAP